ncbi:MAG TPA: ABC transporter permease subunit [Alphaproteobacteria bacterium]|nr:ABC transporter permease subunit [Alphaproteobacteria bacterium]
MMATPAQSIDNPASAAPRRRHTTRRSVLIIDRLADLTITVGGLFVILCVIGIMVFLTQVVVPLFTGARLIGANSFTMPPAEAALLDASIDEHRAVTLRLTVDGKVDLIHIATGKVVVSQILDLGGKQVTAFDRTTAGSFVAFGFADGSVRFGRLGLATEILTPDAVPARLAALDERDRSDGTAIYSPITGNQIRKTSLAASLAEAQVIAAGQAIVAIDYHVGGTSERPVQAVATVDAVGVTRLSLAESRTNIITGKVTTTIDTSELPALSAGTKVAAALTTEKADQVFIADEQGRLFRFDTRDFKAPVLAETAQLLPRGVTLTVMGFLIGEQSLVVGGSDGSLAVFFRLPRPDAGTTDNFQMVRGHLLEPHRSAVVGFSPSARSKTFATADAAGEVWIRHSTSEQTLLKFSHDGAGETLRALELSPREDGVLAVDGRGAAAFWRISAPHPETTMRSLFGRVWYEGYPEPSYTWQSSSGTDSFEPKLSLVPLIFGTIKATLYAMLFAVPVALLAAVYTSEFVHPSVRATVKPVMEMMASLPSVVLGFIAALILAPIVETWIAAVLMAFVALPLALLVSAYLWQLVPQTIALRLQGAPKLALMFVVLALAFYLCYAAGGIFEDVFFAGDVKAWANGDVGSGAPFLFLVLLPIAATAVAMTARRFLGDWISAARRQPGHGAALFDFVRWLAVFACAAAIAWMAALTLDAFGGDPRGGVVDTYVQRNTLVVGFAMGFAVIPIIYTIAEDALNAVPEHLRAASLACGATPWQTGVSVILPTAISGVFAAIMVGMGRAVGETMIVVMAAGNTPILEWNIFSGLRALSANIAVELPEAVKDGTLYRTLFLAALVLFVMTFVVNTMAEIVRQRFRKRAVQL